jgi:hypothetical protein
MTATLERERERKYSRRVDESEESWKSERHFTVGREKRLQQTE